MDLDLAELAKVSRLFEALDNAGRKKLLQLSHRVQLKAGDVVCREGEEAAEFFVLAKGEVRVSAESIDGEKELARLGHGQFFGEMAALNGDRRTATCTALTDIDLVAFPLKAVVQVLGEYPAAREVLHRVGILRSENSLQKMME